MATTEIENIALDPINQNKFNELVKDLDPDAKKACGTMYVGHLPHGFYEKELNSYFSQFGTVNKVRLARSKKTGGYKGYGYIQFASEEVAKIAAEAMNNYLMFEKLLKCQFVPEEKLHPAIWKGANKKFVWLNRSERERKLHNKPRSKEELKKMTRRLQQKDNRRRNKLSQLGIKYDFPGYVGAINKERKQKKLMKKNKRKSKQMAQLKE